MIRFFVLVILFLIAALSVPEINVAEGPSFDYWKRPVEAGLPPERLMPEVCAACHVDRFRQWRGSLHRTSTGPGLAFQIYPYSAPAAALSCYRCHAPLSAQNEIVRDKNGFVKNGAFSKKLKDYGISCAVCHARGGVIYGPISPLSVKAPEGGHPSRKEALFRKAEFCAACHQLDEGFELGGTVLVNTYREWKGSVYGKRGITCQDCHMPGKRHLFRGIHDPVMTLTGVNISARRVDKKGPLRLEIRNTGTGHMFPTYATPLVVVRGFVEGPDGRPVAGTLKEAYIGRKVAVNLSKEFFDTRLAPLESFQFDYPVSSGPGRAVLEVVVYPDEFYERFYRDYMKMDMEPERKKALSMAHKRTTESSYTLFRKDFLLPPP